MQRADYKATLRVIANDGKDFESVNDSSDVDQDEDDQIETIVKMDDFINKTETIISNYSNVSRDNYKINQQYE
jgi:hypothetical protein